MTARIADDCPVCGAALARRKGAKGIFLGCTAFPRCKFTEDYDAIAEKLLTTCREEYEYYRDLLELVRAAPTIERVREIVGGNWLTRRLA